MGNETGMRLTIPSRVSPTALLGGAVAAADAVESAIALVPRAAAALTRMEALLDRTESLVARSEAVATSADQVTKRAAQVVTRAEKVTARTQAVLDVAEIVTRDSSRTVDGASGILNRVDAMLSTWEPVLRGVAPSATRFAESVSPQEVDAAVALVDRLPLLLAHLEDDVLPVLKTLDRVGPDIHELLATAEDLRRVLTGLPGIGFLRKRGDDELPDKDT